LLLSQLGSVLDHLERRTLGRVRPRRPVRAAASACDRFRPDLDQLLEAASAALAPELVDRHAPDGSRAVSRVERSTYTPVGRDPWAWTGRQNGHRTEDDMQRRLVSPMRELERDLPDEAARDAGAPA